MCEVYFVQCREHSAFFVTLEYGRNHAKMHSPANIWLVSALTERNMDVARGIITVIAGSQPIERY